MGRYTKKTTITEDEQLRLAGLLTVGRDLIDQEKRVIRSVEMILGEDAGNGHASDAVWSGYSVDDLLEKSGITVTPSGDVHRARHEQLHRAFDELMADFLNHTPGKVPSDTTLTELMQWSHRQTIAPDELAGDG